jgi:MoxR-like ATPase
MQEYSVTASGKTYELSPPFLVFATQNPIEQEGTYPLPEAQLDRFMMHVRVGYPSRDEERAVMERMADHLLMGPDATGDSSRPDPLAVDQKATTQQLLDARGVVGQVYIDEKIKDYIIDIVAATREPSKVGLKDLGDMVAHGASPRASIALNMASRAHAFVKHRGYVTPEDIKAIGPDVLRHRIIRTYEAEAEEITSEHIVRRIFETVEVP